ncbi:MAG: hypothetical protein GX455_12735 [Phycisphaerae bacterium]|nr:hypothetical protein [Phycisphaerae bacterium]
MKRQGIIEWMVFFMLGWCIPSTLAQDADDAISPNLTTSPAETDAQRQLRIFRTALLQGQTEESRMDAATELLARNDSASRELLMQSLMAKDNPLTRQAICRALIKSRGLSELVSKPEELMKPVVGILSSSDASEARLAGEALLIYSFDPVFELLSKMTADATLDSRTRLNVIYALKLWPEKKAIETIHVLRKDNDKTVAAAAEKALQEIFGVPEGTRSTTLDAKIQDFQNMRSTEFIQKLMAILRDRVARQQEQLRLIGADRDVWKTKYLALQDKEYSAADDSGKPVMLVAKLTSELPAERLWALGKVSTYAAMASSELRMAVLSLISDPDREVRLAAAKVLANKSALDPAEKLLAQLQVEKDNEVGLALFQALGEACSFAFTPGSPIKLPSAIRMETLRLAGQFLAEKGSDRVYPAAEVIRKLLEINGIEMPVAQSYLRMILTRFQATEGQSGPLRGQLLMVMAKLCGKTALRDIAATIYQPAFLSGLSDTEDIIVREAAVTGLANIGKPQAYALFRDRKLMDDPNPAVRKIVIGLVGEVGDEEDLVWLSERLSITGEAEAAWASMVSILQRQGSVVILGWIDKLKANAANLSRVTELLGMAETRLQGDQNSPALLTIRMELLGRYLSVGDHARAVGVVSRRLIEQKDLKSDDPLIVLVQTYLNSGTVSNETKVALINALGAITTPAGISRPNWTEQLKVWQKQYLPQIPSTTISKPEQETPSTPIMSSESGGSPAKSVTPPKGK